MTRRRRCALGLDTHSAIYMWRDDRPIPERHYRNHRADAEIEKAQARITAAQENGRRGGRPKKNPMGSDEKPDGFLLGSKNKTQQKAHHTPDTNHQTPDTRGTTHTTGDSENSGGVCVGTAAGHAAAALNRAGCRVTSQNPNLIAACTEGVTLDLLLEVYGQYPDKPAGYVIAAARRIHAEQARPIPAGVPRETHRNRDRVSLADQVVMPDDDGRPGNVIEGTAVAVSRR